jgi:hypothetical protein
VHGVQIVGLLVALPDPDFPLVVGRAVGLLSITDIILRGGSGAAVAVTDNGKLELSP